MCNFPEVQSKAAAEIENFISLNGRLPTFDEREQLPYCVCLIKESIRFSPTAPFGIPHRITQDGKFFFSLTYCELLINVFIL